MNLQGLNTVRTLISNDWGLLEFLKDFATTDKNSEADIKYINTDDSITLKIYPSIVKIDTYFLNLDDNSTPSIVSNLEGVRYNWKEVNKKDMCFITEDVQEILPELVYKNNEGEVEGMNYSKITAVLVNAIQEQQRQITQMQKDN